MASKDGVINFGECYGMIKEHTEVKLNEVIVKIHSGIGDFQDHRIHIVSFVI